MELKDLIGISLTENAIDFYERLTKRKSGKLLCKVYLSFFIPKTLINGKVNPSRTCRILRLGCKKTRIYQIFNELTNYGVLKKCRGLGRVRRTYYDITKFGKNPIFIEIAEKTLGFGETEIIKEETKKEVKKDEK